MIHIVKMSVCSRTWLFANDMGDHANERLFFCQWMSIDVNDCSRMQLNAWDYAKIVIESLFSQMNAPRRKWTCLRAIDRR